MDWCNKGHAAVITGGASGIGFAAARRFLADGMHVMIADRDTDMLAAAVEKLSKGTADSRVIGKACDVSQPEDLERLCNAAFNAFGAVHCLMNNAGIGVRSGMPWENAETWRTVMEVNLWGVIHGCQAFIPKMLESGVPGAVINTGSKQGITKPPGSYGYNLSKAGVVAYSECTAHALRQIDDCALSAHLLIPGFVYTGMIARFLPDMPPTAWTSEQTVDFMMRSLERGDFYILCPDNETPRNVDEKRIQWNADDIIRNRPALSRWHPDFEKAFADYMKD